MTAAKMLATARKYLGLVGRPNVITKDYASRHGGAFLAAPWCQMAVTRWARESGNDAAVLPEGDRAYTVFHAQDGQDLGRWYAGTVANIKAHAEPGAVLYMDWDGTDAIGRIDHVGIVEKNLGDGRVQSIEGNSGDACKRRVRSASVIAGFWNPPYGTPKGEPKLTPTEVLVKQLPELREGSKGWHVKTVFYLLAARDFAVVPGVDDTVFGPAMGEAVEAFQTAAGIEADRVVGRDTWRKLLKL